MASQASDPSTGGSGLDDINVRSKFGIWINPDLYQTRTIAIPSQGELHSG